MGIAKKKVYLAGPITGDYRDAEWRNFVASGLRRHLVEAINPLDGSKVEQYREDGMKWIRKTRRDLTGVEEALPLSWAARDFDNIKECDLLFVGFPYVPERQAIGTLMEMGMAVALRIPVVLVCACPLFTEHLFVRGFVEQSVDHMDLGIDRAIAILQRQVRQA